MSMKYIRLSSTDPYLNLAIEEYLLNTATDDIFMLWQNANTVVIGKNQNAYAEVNLTYAKENGIRIARRITGGGAVYHDLGNLNYTFITSKNNAKALDYAYFTKPIINALSSLSLTATLSGRNDLLCNGKKFSGNAQFSSADKILHHGTLLFDTDTSVLSSVLKVNKEKLEHNGVKSHESRVVNLKSLLGENYTIEDFICAIEKEIASKAEFCPAPTAKEVMSIYERNNSNEWIYGEKRFITGYKLTKQKKFDFGFVKAEMSLEKDVIKSIVISGDFFGTEPIEDLEKILIGKNITALTPFNPSPYIDKMSFEDLKELLKI